MPLYTKGNKLSLSKIQHKNIAIDKNIIPNHINISTSNRLFNKNASTDRYIYSYQDPYFNGLGKFTRNPNCWINGVANISCFSPAQLSGAAWQTRAGTLITTKHIIQAQHYLTSILPGGTPIIFVDDNNNVIRRNIMSYALDPARDIAVGVLDNDVPSNIKIAKVLPTNFSTYIRLQSGNQINNFVSFDLYPYLYSVVLDQEEKAILKLFTGCYSGAYTTLATISSSPLSANQLTTMVPDPAQFSSWSEPIVVGDSGNPAFLIIDNELVILSTFWTGSGGPFVSDVIGYNTINSLIENLSPNQGYSLTPIDLDFVYNKLLAVSPIDKTIISNHINSSTANRLLNKDSSTDRLVYSSQNPYGGVGDAGIWVRNPSCWLNGVSNISCFSPAQRSGANWWQRGGTLITKKHALFAKHFVTSILPDGGTPLIFVDENNNAIKRNIIQYGHDDTDIAVALLDSEVPNNIKIAKVLPTNFRDYIGNQVVEVENNGMVSSWFTPYLYAVALDQEEKAILKLCSGTVGTNSSGGVRYISAELFSPSPSDNYSSIPQFEPYPSPNQFSSWSEPVIVGDSGNPIFLIIDNELVVLTTWWTPGNGPFVSDTTRYNTINSIIENLSPGQGYSLTPINLELVYYKYS